MQQEQDAAARILKVLKYRSRGLTISDIAREAGIGRNKASRQLELLQANGQVELKEFGSAKVYYRAQRVPLSAFLCFTRNLIVVLDSANRIVQVNDQYCKLARREKNDLVGLTLTAANLPVVSTPEAMAVIEGLEKEQVITDLRYPHEDKDLIFHLQVIPTTFEDGEKGATIILEDITDQHRIMDALKRSEENLHAFMFALSQPAHLIDNEGTVLASNEVAPRRLGVRIEDYVGKDIGTYLSSDIAESRSKYLEKAVREKMPVMWEDSRLGLHYEHHLYPIIEKDGSVIRLAHIGFNTTALKRTEAALRESEERFHEVFNLAPIPAAIIQNDSRFIFVNPQFTDLFGYTQDDIISIEGRFNQLFPDLVLQEEAVVLWKTDPGKAITGRVRCKNGEEKTIRFCPITLGDGNQYITFEEISSG